MRDCEDLRTPVSAIVTVLSIALVPFALLVFLLVRWIVSPLPNDRVPREMKR